MAKKILLSLLLLSFLCGCHNPCRKNVINPVFIGFPPAEIDTFILRAYQPNDNYQHLVDTLLVHGLYATIYTTINDSTYVYINDSDPDRMISDGFDWQIYLPGANRTFLVSGIAEEKTEGNKRCLNPIIAFKLDGQSVTPQPVSTGNFYTSGYMVYIHR
jgi:hypothetical protein